MTVRFGAIALLLAVCVGCESDSGTPPNRAVDGSQLPPILQDEEVSQLLTAAPSVVSNGATVEGDLQRAREAYASLSSRVQAGYHCVYYYQRADVLNGTNALADEDQQKLDAAKRVLIANVVPLYRQATDAARQQQWSDAAEKLRQLCRLLPSMQGETSKLTENIRAHLDAVDKARKRPQPSGGG